MFKMLWVLCFVFFISIVELICAEKLDPTRFTNDVLDDERVWAIEFYSGMCGSCKEFAPKWEFLQEKMSAVVTSKVNIDEKPGMDLAQKLGVLQEGLPNIRLFSNTGQTQGIPIMPGTEMTSKELWAKLKRNVQKLDKNADGFYLKSNRN